MKALRTLAFRLGAITVAGMALFLGACETETYRGNTGDIEPVSEEPLEEEVAEVDPDVEEVSEETAAYIGDTVTITGEVEEIYGPDSFRLEETGELLDDDTVLVLSVDPVEPIYEEQEVTVTGEVREFVMSDIEVDYDLTWDADLQREIEAEYEGKPVVIAESTLVVDESTL